MKKLLNTLYITSSASYLALDGENVVVWDGDSEIGRLPLHNLEEKVEWGMVPFAQAMLLARYLRGDLDEYPPFLWK